MMLGSNAQRFEWPDAPVKEYPKKGDKKHVLDYIHLDVTDWEQYTAGNKNQTNQEIQALATYYTKDNEFVFSTTVGVRLSGFFIRKLPQKSIAVEFSKKKFNSEKVNYEMWSTRDYDELDGFVLRAHGNPLGKTYFKDAYMNMSLDEYTDLEYSAARPVILYINGAYQGLYNIREKKNKDFVQNVHGISKKGMSLFDVNGGVNVKVNKEWEDLIKFANLVSFKNDENYRKIENLIDIDNFIDYHIAHIFYCNTDWPKANVKVWKPIDGKWRWIFFDCDRGHSSGSVNFNTIEHLTGEDQWAKRRGDNKVDVRLNKASILLRKLVENEEFKNKFILRYQDLLNTSFTEDRLNLLIDAWSETLRPEVQQHIDRWLSEDQQHAYQHMASIANWEKNIDQMRFYVAEKQEWERKNVVMK